MFFQKLFLQYIKAFNFLLFLRNLFIKLPNFFFANLFKTNIKSSTNNKNVLSKFELANSSLSTHSLYQNGTSVCPKCNVLCENFNICMEHLETDHKVIIMCIKNSFLFKNIICFYVLFNYYIYIIDYI